MNLPKLGRLLSSMSGLHWLVVILSLTLTFVAWSVSSRIAADKARSEFQHSVEQMTEHLQDRMSNYAFALISGVGAIQSHPQGLTWEEWRRFSGSLALPERLPGINGIGIIYRVEPENLDSFIENQRQKRPDFRVHPPHETNDYWPITYIEPEASNKRAIGLDMAHETNRYNAAKKAMRTGETQITGPIVLVQDAEKTPGFLFYQPYYETLDTPPVADRERLFQGLVYAPFIMKKLMSGTLANIKRRVQIRISDQGTILYDELLSNSSNYDPAPMFRATLDLPMYGRQWMLEFQTTTLFSQLNASRQPTVILISGLVIDALILLVFILLARAKQRAEVRASAMTRHFDNEAKKLKAVLDTVSEAIVTTDDKGFIMSTNPAANRLFGTNRQGEHVIGLFADDFLARIEKHTQHSNSGTVATFEFESFDDKGESFPSHVGFAKAELDSGAIFTYTIRDTSLEKAADTAKNQFVSTVSHELRTPLAAISGAAALLSNQLGKDIEPVSTKMLDIIGRNSERLSLLVNDLLDIEGFSSGSIRLSRRPENLSEIARKAINDCGPFAVQWNTTIEFADLSDFNTVFVDRSRIEQVILNLISNAIKFSPEGSEVRVEIQNKKSNEVCLRVIDSGEGIPDSYRKKAFSRFSQIDSSDSRRKNGSGLGLSICKAIVDLHDGIIDYESAAGKGTTFYFCLSLATEAALADFISP